MPQKSRKRNFTHTKKRKYIPAPVNKATKPRAAAMGFIKILDNKDEFIMLSQVSESDIREETSMTVMTEDPAHNTAYNTDFCVTEDEPVENEIKLKLDEATTNLAGVSDIEGEVLPENPKLEVPENVSSATTSHIIKQEPADWTSPSSQIPDANMEELTSTTLKDNPKSTSFTVQGLIKCEFPGCNFITSKTMAFISHQAVHKGNTCSFSLTPFPATPKPTPVAKTKPVDSNPFKNYFKCSTCGFLTLNMELMLGHMRTSSSSSTSKNKTKVVLPQETGNPNTVEIQTSKMGRKNGGRYCCIPGCNNNRNRNINLSFHRFPENASLKRKWISAINRKGDQADTLFSPKASHRVCSEHFPGGVKSPGAIPSNKIKLADATPSRKTKSSLNAAPRKVSKDMREEISVAVMTEDPAYNSVYKGTKEEPVDIEIKAELFEVTTALPGAQDMEVAFLTGKPRQQFAAVVRSKATVSLIKRQ